MTKAESNIASLTGSRIRQTDPSAEVVLFGSHARGHAKAESDWETKHPYSSLYMNIKEEGIRIA